MQTLCPEAPTLFVSTSGWPTVPFLRICGPAPEDRSPESAHSESPCLRNSPHQLGFLRERRVCLSLVIIDLFLPNCAFNLNSLGCRQKIWGWDSRKFVISYISLVMWGNMGSGGRGADEWAGKSEYRNWGSFAWKRLVWRGLKRVMKKCQRICRTQWTCHSVGHQVPQAKSTATQTCHHTFVVNHCFQHSLWFKVSQI